MAFDLIPRSFFPRVPDIWDEDEDFWSLASQPSGLSVSEDDKNVYVEAALPGVDPDKVDITFDKGILWVKGGQEQEEKDKSRKYYRKASTAFSYRVAVPGNVDEKAEPQATYKNGVMRITFAKVPEVQPKKIAVKKE